MKKVSYLVFLAMIGIIFVVLTKLSFNDWRACFYETPAVPFSWRLLVPSSLKMPWVYWLPVFPFTLLVLGRNAPDRKAWITGIVVLGLGFWLMFPGDTQHDCDQKGTDVELWLILLFPVSVLMTLFVLFARWGERDKA